MAARAASLLAATVALAACAAPQPSTAPAAAVPGTPSPYFVVIDRICRDYAGLQKAQPADLMYDQCMYARGYLVPGFSPSPNMPGYQGPLLGPATIGGGN